MTARIRALLATAALAMGSLAAAGMLDDPALADHTGSFIDEEVDCLEAVPAHLSLASSPTVSIGTRVVLHGATAQQRDAAISEANQIFAARGVRLEVTGTDVVSLSGSDARGVIEQVKDHYGRRVPAGSDIVLILTGHDLTGSGGSATAGLADCIGGARFRQHGFAVAEVRRSSTAGRLAAHEVGHLLGAHHHYASCIEEGGATLRPHVGFPPCTVMINDVGLARPAMSQLTGRVVRGHAERL